MIIEQVESAADMRNLRMIGRMLWFGVAGLLDGVERLGKGGGEVIW